MVVALVGVVVFLVSVRPRRVWWALSSWRYRHPEANEPSDVAYGLQGVFGVLFGAALVGVGVWMAVTLPTEEERDRELQEERERNAELREDCEDGLRLGPGEDASDFTIRPSCYPDSDD